MEQWVLGNKLKNPVASEQILTDCTPRGKISYVEQESRIKPFSWRDTSLHTATAESVPASWGTHTEIILHPAHTRAIHYSPYSTERDDDHPGDSKHD